MKRSFLLSIMVLAVISAGSMAVRAQQDPYEPASATATQAEPASTPAQSDTSGEATATAQEPTPAGSAATDTATPAPTTDTQSETQMPKTASPMPLIALIGLLSIVASLSLRSMARFANGGADASRR
jgi:cobalamin biosynthesis Mg chelatase CobN